MSASEEAVIVAPVRKNGSPSGLREALTATRRELALYRRVIAIGVAFPEFLFAWVVGGGFLLVCVVVLRPRVPPSTMSFARLRLRRAARAQLLGPLEAFLCPETLPALERGMASTSRATRPASRGDVVIGSDSDSAREPSGGRSGPTRGTPPGTRYGLRRP